MTTTARLGEYVNAVEIIREDHRRIKALFREFESADEGVRPSIAQQAIEEIQRHAAVEEEIFYPALRKATGDVDLVLEAREAHHAAKMMIAELKLIPRGRRFNAKFLTLAKSVAQHMKEEEDVLLPMLESSGVDLARVGRDMAAMKYAYLEGGLPVGRSGLGFGPIGLVAGLCALAYLFLRTEEGA